MIDATQTTLKILIVDDDKTNRMILRAILIKDGHSVVEAQDGCDAISIFEKEQPDMILMDIMMPVMDGYEATRRIKREAGDRFVPVIFLTAVLDDKALAKCVECGGDDFLNKPYNRIILKAKIDALSRVRTLYSALKQKNDELFRHHERLQHEHAVAERVFSKIVQSGNLDNESMRYMIAPMAIANGDFILAAKKPMGGRHVMLGDFTGHGLSAALGAIPVSDIFYKMTSEGFSILDVAAEINKKLRDKLPTGFFLAACLLELDADEREVRVWNGGLPDVIIYGADHRIKARIASQHLPLGVIGNAQLQHRADAVELDPGDRVFVYSDGVIEARNPSGELFSEVRLEQYFKADLPANAIFDEICGGLNTFREGAAQTDDITIIEVIPSPNPRREFAGANEESAPYATEWQMNIELGPSALRTLDVRQLFVQVLEQMPRLQEHRSRLYTVLAELYSNALEHGVLKLDSGVKHTAEGFSEYYDRRASALAGLRDGRIQVCVRHESNGSGGGAVMVVVEDSGAGFDNPNPPDTNNDMSTQKSGRGLSLVESVCDEVKYGANGNRIEAWYRWH